MHYWCRDRKKILLFILSFTVIPLSNYYILTIITECPDVIKNPYLAGFLKSYAYTLGKYGVDLSV